MIHSSLQFYVMKKNVWKQILMKYQQKRLYV